MYCQQQGDIIFQEEGHWRDKISRYIMSSKSIWHCLLGFKNDVLYYHTSIVYAQDLIIEQKRWGMQIKNWKPNKNQIIFRPKTVNKIFHINNSKYDFLNCFGHLLAWITGIKYFKNLHSKHRQHCVLMVMNYCHENCNEKFPIKNFWTWHTQDLYKYFLNNPNYEIVYKNE